MEALDSLKDHAREFTEATGINIELVEEGNRIFILLKRVRLSPGLRPDVSDVLFIADTQYPLSTLDMFWTEVEVVWSDGAVPRCADAIEEYVGRRWRRFSWHANLPSSPARNRLLDHLAFVEARWAEERKP